MLAAAARAGSALREENYKKRATQNAEFIKKHLFKDGLLLRVAYSAPDDQISL